MLLAGAAALAAASASVTAGQQRRERLQRELDAFVYPKPLDDVWQEARRLLAERGYPLAGKDAEAVGQKPMSWAERFLSPARETAPAGAEPVGLLQKLSGASGTPGVGQVLDTGWTQYGERVHLHGWSDAGGCRIVIQHLKRDATDRRAEETRDVELELELVRRVDAAAAERLDKGAAPPAAG